MFVFTVEFSEQSRGFAVSFSPKEHIAYTYFEMYLPTPGQHSHRPLGIKSRSCDRN